MKKNECGQGGTSEPFRSQAKIRHNRSRFTLPFIPFLAVTAPEPDVGTIVVPEKQNEICFSTAD